MGQQDIPLNDFGHAQARDVTPRVHTLDIKTLCVSPLTRARQTAQIINEGWNKPVKFIEDLKEVSWGEHEGDWQDDGSNFHEWIHGKFIPPGGESLRQFVERVKSGVTQALEQPGPILIVSHGGVFYGLQILLKLPLDFALSNCELIHVKQYQNMWAATPV